VSVSSVS